MADRQAVQCHANHHILTITKELFSVDGFCFFQFLQLFQRWLFNSLSSSIWTDSNIQKDQLFTSRFVIYLFLSGKSTNRFQPVLYLAIIRVPAESDQFWFFGCSPSYNDDSKIELLNTENDEKGLKRVCKSLKGGWIWIFEVARFDIRKRSPSVF